MNVSILLVAFNYITPFLWKQSDYILFHLVSKDAINSTSDIIYNRLMNLKDYIQGILPNVNVIATNASEYTETDRKRWMADSAIATTEQKITIPVIIAEYPNFIQIFVWIITNFMAVKQDCLKLYLLIMMSILKF